MTRKRIIWGLGIVAGLLLAIAIAAVFTARSDWFREKVRQRIVSTAETATGGKAEIGAFRFDWRLFRAQVDSFVLHGTEPPEDAPLFRASTVVVGLKIVSVLKRDVDIQYLDVTSPRIHLIVAPDGRTNIPSPKVKTSTKTPEEAILDLAIGRFGVTDGVFEIESHSRTPFEMRGRNLITRLYYESAGPRYHGDVSVQPLEMRWPGYPVDAGVEMKVAMERNRILAESGKATEGASVVTFSGALENLAAPRVSVRYDARLSVPDVARITKLRELEGGTAEIKGNATWSAAAGLSATGDLRASNVDYRDTAVRLRGFRFEGAVSAGENGVDVSRLRLSGSYLPQRRPAAPIPLSGSIADATLRGRDITLRGMAIEILGGVFNGETRLLNLRRYTVDGEIAGFAAKRAIAIYSPEPLPWDSRVSGTVRVEGVLGQKEQLRASGNLTLAPAPEGPPVRGQVTATYDARSGTLDLGRSTVELPSSRADFSGVIGTQLRVHLETRDLNDILPALGESSASIPVKLEKGSAVFDGTVTGTLDRPDAAGHINITGVSYEGSRFDSLSADVAASPDLLRVQNATLQRGSLRAQFAGSVGLREWKADEHTAISGSGAIRNASIPDIAALLDRKDLPVTGALTATASVTGTIGDPRVSGDVDIAKGSVDDEPFDHFTAHVSYSGAAAEIADGRLEKAGAVANISARFEHAPGSYQNGRLHFQVSSEAMPLEQIRTLQKERPGIKGIAQVKAVGDLSIAAAPGKNSPSTHLVALNADIWGRGLQLTGQALGDAHLTATSERGLLRAHLDTGVAGSIIRGDGEWRLEGDYPGSATITLSKVDFAQLRAWIQPAKGSAAERVAGFAEGQVRVEGPLLRRSALKAELRIPALEIRPAPGNLPPQTETFVLRNSGPLVATLANDVITVETAHLVGRATDLTIAGRATLPVTSGNALDMRVNGKIDLAILQTLDPDLNSSGVVTTSANVRGSLDSPQIFGSMQFQNAAFSLTDFPNTISNGSGNINFTRSRATIQKFTGETGGGTITITGFADYGGEKPLFRLHADAAQIRVRYPEGVSTVADANLNLTGTLDQSVLSGTVTVQRTGFNPQSDFSSLIARSAEPVRTPSGRSGLLGGMSFDVQITTSPFIQFQSSLTQDLQVDANLTLRGTPANPALLGRITISQGQLVFYGTRFNINQGSISFYNPAKIEPILDIDLETKARGIDITLSVTGPLTKPNLTPRSDPPLQFSEIVALLATGRTPTSDPTLLAQQSNAPQSFQQTGASALLGQAIASPVAGRLQRFFGVSKLRIDPTLPGVENNPQARLTLEQQVTPDITFTYITNITNSNPQVVRVEWAVSKQWSVVALREENGMFGLDFFFKRRF